MADDGGGLELNLVSEPVAVSKATAPRKKKRGSGKAWDKKKKPASTTTTSNHNSQVQSGLGNQQPRQQQQQQQQGRGGRGQARAQRSGTISESDGQKGRSQTTAVPATPAGGAAANSGPSPGGVSAAGDPAATNSWARQKSGKRPNLGKEQAAGNAAAPPNHTGNRSSASPKVQAVTLPGREGGGRSNSNGNNSKADGNNEPSNERRRVLEMAGRSLTPRTPVPAPADGAGEAHTSKSGGGGVSTKRKRLSKGAAGGASPGPVASSGVIDFTVGDDTTTPKKTKKQKKDGPEAESKNKNRKAAATAAAVAEDTAVMAKSGGKWWDDEDDDHVVVETKAKRQISTSYYAAGGGFGGWKPGARTDGGAGDEHGDAAGVEDKDGGLPSDVHPNSVRTKAVDMDGEASNAMGILEALLGKWDGVGGGPREESRRIKNGGKSKKKAKQKPLPMDGVSGGASAVRAADASAAAVDDSDGVPAKPLAMDVGGADAEGEEPTAAGTSPSQSGAFAAEGGDDKTPSTASEGTSGDGAGAGGSSNGAIAFASRKNRARVANAAAAAAADNTVPLPEHHARPRELSRRAAVRPLASARSAHVMAAGPGATFAALNLPPKMVSHLEEPKGDLGGGGMGLVGPTVCQLAAMPVLAAGNNTVIKSETGSGKTLAYLLPMLCDLAAMEPRVEREMGTLAIVLAPTRELGSQILEVLTRVVRPFIWLVPGSLSGGERRKSEKARLRKGVTVLVCTPGRLLDHLKATKCFRRDSLRWFILDEADRLLDMGFEKQVKEIVELLDQSARAVRSGPAGGTRVEGGAVVPSIKVIRRQTIMVSATLDKGVSRLSAALLSKHIRVDADANVVESVDEFGKVKHISGDRAAATASKHATANPGSGGSRNDVHGIGDPSPASGNDPNIAEEFSTPRQLVQHYMTVTQKLRLPALCAFLRARAREKVVVFMSTCDAVDFHHDLFRRAGWPGDATASSPANEGGSGGDSGEGKKSSKQAVIDGGGQDKNGSKKKGASKADGEFFGPDCLVRRLHGNVAQNERQATYRAFGAAKSGILICTDVAARGLDLPTVDWIVQYDPPAETADYVHRVGRTARKGERGHSLLFLLPREAAYLGVLEARGLRPKPLSLEGVLCAADAGKRDARRADEQLAYELQQGLQLLVAGDKPLLDRARAAFQSHVRAYAARAPDSRAVFQVRSLHLGHVARSFALKDPPTAVKVGKKVVRRPGDSSRGGKGGESGATRGKKRRRDGAGGAGGSVHRLGLSKQTKLASRAEFL